MSDYDFIFEDNTPAKTSSLLNRVLVIAGGLATLGLIAIILFGVILKPDTGPTDTLVQAYAANQDLIAISKEADKELTDSNALGLATGSRIVLTSDGQKLLTVLASLERQVSPNEITSSQDKNIRSKLQSAITVNRYNEVFVEEYTQKLREYAAILQQVYQEFSSPNTQLVIEQSFNNILVLIGEDAATENPKPVVDESPKTDTNTDEEPATDAGSE